VILPCAEAAVAALESVADGFFISRQRASGSVTITHKNGREESVPPARAVAPLLAARRNATHGFGGKTADVRAARLLAQHDGTIPDELIHLPFLYLLEVLCDWEGIRHRIEGQSRRAEV